MEVRRLRALALTSRAGAWARGRLEACTLPNLKGRRQGAGQCEAGERWPQVGVGVAAGEEAGRGSKGRGLSRYVTGMRDRVTFPILEGAQVVPIWQGGHL